METNKTLVKPFYMVYVMGMNSPVKTYDKEEDAYKEAQRLCEKERRSAYVLKAVRGCEYHYSVDEITVKED